MVAHREQHAPVLGAQQVRLLRRPQRSMRRLALHGSDPRAVQHRRGNAADRSAEKGILPRESARQIGLGYSWSWHIKALGAAAHPETVGGCGSPVLRTACRSMAMGSASGAAAPRVSMLSRFSSRDLSSCLSHWPSSSLAPAASGAGDVAAIKSCCCCHMWLACPDRRKMQQQWRRRQWRWRRQQQQQRQQRQQQQQWRQQQRQQQQQSKQQGAFDAK